MRLSPTKPTLEAEMLTMVAAACRAFDEDPRRAALVAREAALRSELDAVERELLGPPAPAEEDPAAALAEGREAPAARDRLALVQRRQLLHDALAVLARRRGEVDADVARVVLGGLVEPYAQLVAAQARRVRAVAELNDVLREVSESLERAGATGASSVLFPMIFTPAGRWSDPHGAARAFWREAVEHGFV